MAHMHEHPSTALQPEDLSPRTLHQIYQHIVAAAQAHVQVGRQLVAVCGVLGPMRDSRAPIFYRVPLHDHGETIYLDIPKALMRQTDIREGDHIRAIGSITTECTQFTDYRLLFKVDVSNLMVVDAPPDLARHRDEQATLALLKEKTARVPFPQVPPLHLSVLHATSGQVSGDFQHEIDKVADVVDVAYHPVNMLHPDAIADAIKAAEGDVLVLIRGGGAVEQFRVFEEPRVLRAFADRTDIYRVVGLGHTHNTTLLDLVSDFAAKTPSLAGSHIREQIERHVYPLVALRNEQARNSTLRAQITALETGRARPGRTRPRSLATALALLLVGVLLGLIGGVWIAR